MTVVPVVLIEPKCPKHPNAKNIKVGGDGSMYTEFYCKYCKKIYVAKATIKQEVEGMVLKLSVTEKKESQKENMVIEDGSKI